MDGQVCAEFGGSKAFEFRIVDKVGDGTAAPLRPTRRCGKIHMPLPEIEHDLQHVACKMDPVVGRWENRVRYSEGAFDLESDVEAFLSDRFGIEVVEAFDPFTGEVRKEKGLKGAHADVAHERDGIGRQVSTATGYMGADHGDEAIGRRLRLEEVGRSEFGVVGDRICTADFEFDPKAPGAVGAFQEDINPGLVPEEGLQVGGQKRDFVTAGPARGTEMGELLLEIGS